MERESFEGWAIVELMGHVRVAGYVRQEEICGQALLRVDIPGSAGWVAELRTCLGPTTQYYHPNALYCLTPTTEEIARAVAKRSQRPPVQRWELPPPCSNGPTEEEQDAEGTEGLETEL